MLMHTRIHHITVCFGFVFSACGDPGDPELDLRRARGGAELITGSCVDACGGQTLAGNCWCDDSCTEYGDCCSDKDTFCDLAGAPKPTCQGACGTQGKNGNCWCDDQCAEYGDCCADQADHCEAPACEAVSCKLYCPFGWATNEKGCETCACAKKLCGGFAGFSCPGGFECIDDPDDDCDPNHGGSDCSGMCATSATACEPVACELYCEDGFAVDASGCAVCACAGGLGN